MRRLLRLSLLSGTVVLVLLDGFFCKVSGSLGRPGRALWLRRNARRLARALDLDCHVQGPLPEKGLILANHLGYLDIVLIGAVLPCRFIAKQEVRSWPVFGWFSSLGGTIFVDRESKLGVMESTRQIHEALNGGELLVLFPEGTSSGGQDVLPFKSSLLMPSVSLDIPTIPAALSYCLEEGDVSEEVCYWKDMTLFPHLVHLAGHRGLSGHLILAGGRVLTGMDRKEAARAMRDEVLGLKNRLEQKRG